jgi:hypothetical protein
MSFPISPTNGQLATVNGIVYSYDSASFSWTRTSSALSGIANLIVTNNGNITNIYSSVGNFTGNLIAAGIVGAAYYGQINLGTTGVNLNRASASQTFTGVGIDGTAATATNAINTQVTSNISSGTAYVTFVSATAGNAAQNLNTALTYNPNSGNLRAYGVLTDTGIYWAGNGAAFSSAPGGTTGQLQYNNSNQFTGANIVFNNANGNLAITSTTTSTSTTTGALVVRGGVGASGNLVTSGNLYVGVTGSSMFSGAVINVPNQGTDGLYVYQNNTAYLTLRPNQGAGSNSPLTQAGDQGIIYSTGTVDNGALTVAQWSNSSRGFRIDGSGHFTVGSAGNLIVAATTTSTSTTTGALVVRGGAGFAANIFTSGWIIPTSNVSQNLGSTTAWWNIFYGRAVQAQYADLAENYTADQDYAPGTVVVFGGEKEVTTTTLTHDTRVAGVISTNPGYLMNAASEGLPVAFTGRVPCQVRGPVAKGTVLVTSDTPGVAEAINFSMFRPGCVLGKSLENIESKDIKTIEVVVGRF